MEAFHTLRNDERHVRTLLKSNCLVGHGLTYSWWKMHRSLIARAVHKSGSILDIGCANGFLLRCLMEWSSHALVPYGFDAVHASIAIMTILAKRITGLRLMPGRSRHR